MEASLHYFLRAAASDAAGSLELELSMRAISFDDSFSVLMKFNFCSTLTDLSVPWLAAIHDLSCIV